VGVSDGWLIDRSALARISASPDATEWAGRVERGFVQITTATLLEIGHSARSGADWHDRVLSPPAPLMPIATLTPAAERRALEVQGLLARAGHHRAPSVPDLLIAATAEVHGLTVLHLDKDFELIAHATGQPVEWLRVE
jgi:predicted nucleic acid-binding protein